MIDLEAIFKELHSMYLQKLITYNELLDTFNKCYHQALIEWDMEHERQKINSNT